MGTTTGKWTDLEKEMGPDWSHPVKSAKRHHPASSEVESPREEEKRTLQKQLATGPSAELKLIGYNWKEAERKAQVRVRWRGVVDDLCSTWSDGPK